MSDPIATVAICTRNRARVIARALECLVAVRVPAGTSWEVLVVDNGSTDDTLPTVSAFSDRLPLRTVVEGEPGVSAARNRAVQEARGTYMLWIDDDALVSEGWLAAFLDAFVRWPGASLLGGPIDVAFDGPLPAWFERILPGIAGIYAFRDLGAEPLLLPPLEHMLPFGTNYVTRTADQRRFRYDETLGRHPAHPGRGSEETDLMLTMLESGLEGRWVPGARVTHLKSVDRATTAFIAAHSADYGAYRARRFPSAAEPTLAGVPLSAWRRLARSAWRYGWRRPLRPAERWIHQFVAYHEARGAIRALRARR